MRQHEIQATGEILEPARMLRAAESNDGFTIDDQSPLQRPGLRSSDSERHEYIPILGDISVFALFRRRVELVDTTKALETETLNLNGTTTNAPSSHPKVDTAKDIEDFENTVKFNTEMRIRFFTPDKVSFRKCAEILSKEISLQLSQHTTSDELQNLWSISNAANLYAELHGATIDVRAIRQNFGSSRWFTAAKALKSKTSELGQFPNPFEMAHAISFACISMLETGHFDLDPFQLTNVMAISAADSLFIASDLLRDPAECFARDRIRRVTGNVGRAGFAFLVPPVEPMIKEYGITEWHLLDYNGFDGNIHDNFSSTSLHLSFTEATFPIDIGFSGARDIEAFFLETLISVYDAGKWVADLDPLKVINSIRVRWVTPCHDNKGDPPLLNMTSIDGFAEMICPPENIGIVRARGNWQARLAATAICAMKWFSVIVVPDDICWRCVNIEVERAQRERKTKHVIIIS